MHPVAPCPDDVVMQEFLNETGNSVQEAPESCDCRFREGGLQRGGGIVWGADGLEKMGGGLDGGTCHMSFWGCLCGGGIRTWRNVFFSFFDSPSSASKLSHWRLACLLSFFLSQFTSLFLPNWVPRREEGFEPLPRKAHPFDSRLFPAGILKERPPAPPTGIPLARDICHLPPANLVESIIYIRSPDNIYEEHQQHHSPSARQTTTTMSTPTSPRTASASPRTAPSTPQQQQPRTISIATPSPSPSQRKASLSSIDPAVRPLPHPPLHHNPY